LILAVLFFVLFEDNLNCDACTEDIAVLIVSWLSDTPNLFLQSSQSSSQSSLSQSSQSSSQSSTQPETLSFEEPPSPPQPRGGTKEKRKRVATKKTPAATTKKVKTSVGLGRRSSDTQVAFRAHCTRSYMNNSSF